MDYQGRFVAGLVVLAWIFCFSVPGFAALEEVSDGIAFDGDPHQVTVSLANGLPIWYEDETGLRLAQCLDQNVLISEEIGTVNPCSSDPDNIGVTFPQFPPSLTNLSRLNYWEATAAFNYLSLDNDVVIPGGLALLVLRLAGEGAGIGALVEGNQAVAARIRLRIDVPIPGTYRVTHPFGTVDYVIDDPGRRSINQTQDVGKLAEDRQNFLVAMSNRVGFELPGPDDNFDPNEDEGPFGAIVNQDGRTIGPFLVPSEPFDPADLIGGPILAASGDRYIALPSGPSPPVPPEFIFQPVTAGPPIDLLGEGGTQAVDYFRIELLEPPPGFFLNATADPPSQILESRDFQVVGKIFDDGPNVAPAAPEVTVGLLKGRSVVDIDVFAGVDLAEFHPVGPTNVHGINPQAIALAHPVDGVFRRDDTNMPFLTQPRTLENGSIRRITRLASGQSLFRYIPVAGAQGTDTFHYVAQDTGGLMSAPTAARVMIEDLRVEQAEFRARTGKWRIHGTTDQPLIDAETDNTLTLMAGPSARLSGAGLEPVVDSAMRGQVALRVGPESIDVRLIIDGIAPQGSIASVNLHVDGPGQPDIFRLCGNPFLFPNPPACTVVDGRLEISRSLTAMDDLLFAGALGVLDLDGAIDAIFSGNTYVNVVTAAHPGGEIRGALETPVLAEGISVSGQDWTFQGKSPVPLGLLPNVTVRSATGAQTYSIPVRVR